ncbi:MAG: UDP-N-acetylmuramoyl-L-alanyl-D-glutamate--2,6-diaminopimelate ligase [Planctomycetes bacterium]|nr:UDP-N-acetylmuramoyl-L-alanyl-D-glutamate--2,6-diaminopimelate ligase [Planctomycetota bacterium]
MIFNELIKLVSKNKSMRICIDSRCAGNGDVFVAIKGSDSDGHDFINHAIENGAKYIVCQNKEQWASDERQATGNEFIVVENSAIAAAKLAQAAKNNPALKLINLAVTGTNGKTTVAYLTRSVIETAGEKCGLLSTITYDTAGEKYESNLTTPSCLTIAEKQSQMLQAGAKYMVIEASSHGICQNRLAAIDFKAAAFTNLAGDHLDYHKTQKEYLSAKIKLFEQLSANATAVLNKQSPQAKHIAKKTKAKILWYAIDEKTDITAQIKSADITGTIFTLEFAGESVTVKTPLAGMYNVSNHLAAAGLCIAAGFDLKTIAVGLSALKNVPGRLEKIEHSDNGQRATGNVFIDYAHTDDGLEKVLSTLKPLCKGKLTVVFGCGGDRDKTKRPRMAKTAEKFADFIIVTNDNPRTESPKKIIDEIIAGFNKSRTTSNEQLVTKLIEPDRKQAIELAIKSADKNDIVLIAGKGHENYQIIGKEKLHFSDKEIALEFLNKKMKNKKQ